MVDPKKDEHIEELLSKLQGIFGKLSHAEEEEASRKIEVPLPAPKEAEPTSTVESPATPSAPTTESAPPAPISVDAAAPFNLYADPAAAPPASPPEPQAAPSPEQTAPPSAYESSTPVQDPERLIVPTAVFYPPGRETEAKSLAQKLETMAPKFTKVAFRLRVGVFMPYDTKSDWKDTIRTKATESGVQTIFVIVDRALDDAKRKLVATELEANNLYFQDVLFSLIEKKAFYTDILLGLVFFFDSHRAKSGSEGTTT